MTLCHICGACETNCPIGAIELFEDIVYVCDLCDGQPRCVEACTEGALTWYPERIDGPSLDGEKEATKKLNPSQKRKRYLDKQGEALRKQWRKVHA
jgi:Fe-S-cluster-containing hydrogenase component 2